MRPFLFSGKNKISGEWVYGNLFSSSDGCTYIVDSDNFKNIVMVDPETVRQYTGVTDKNNYKIFEFDILVNNRIIGFVTYEGDTFFFNWTTKAVHNRNRGKTPLTKFPYFRSLKKIGNIFDNRNLLLSDAA